MRDGRPRSARAQIQLLNRVGTRVPQCVPEYVLIHVIKKLGDAGVEQAAFSAGAMGRLQAAENVHGFRVKTLEKVYNGLSSTSHLTAMDDSRSKFGT